MSKVSLIVGRFLTAFCAFPRVNVIVIGADIKRVLLMIGHIRFNISQDRGDVHRFCIG